MKEKGTDLFFTRKSRSVILSAAKNLTLQTLRLRLRVTFSSFVNLRLMGVSPENKSVPFFAVLLLSLFSFAGCGYQIAGRGVHIPGGVRTIAIPVFENRTLEPIVEEELTPAVIKEFIRDSRVEVVDRSQAGLILRGSVTSYKESPLSFDQNQNVLEYRITVITHLILVRQSSGVTTPDKEERTDNESQRDRNVPPIGSAPPVGSSNGSNEILWERDVTESAEYRVSSDVMPTRVAKLLALREIARNLAQDAADRVLQGW
ncbi:MAG: LptE family protein [Nitrospirae bacterium]|nr:LptE family protein [Nitrospirota bacterium]MBI5097189.1 LptE family protein [Nitrospirota bacterium]